MSWNGFGVDPFLNFERKFEDDAAPTSYFGSNFLLKIPIDSRLVFFERKFNYLQPFQKQRKPNFNVFQAENAFQIAAESSNVFLSIFEIFHRMYLFLYPIYFSKKISSEAKGRDKPIR